MNHEWAEPQSQVFLPRRGWVRRGRRALVAHAKADASGTAHLRTWETLPSRAITKSSTSDPVPTDRLRATPAMRAAVEIVDGPEQVTWPRRRP